MGLGGGGRRVRGRVTGGVRAVISAAASALWRCRPRMRYAAAPRPLTGLTMEQAARILALRPRVVRRAIAWGCPAAALTPPQPAGYVANGINELSPKIASQPAPLPFDIASGPLLPAPSWLPVPTDMGIPISLFETAEAASVSEPAGLAVLICGMVALAFVRREE